MRQTILAVLSLSTLAVLLTGCGGDLVLLNSKGPVAAGQSNLMMTAIYLMLLVVIPSIIMALWFGWKYHASNKDADYKPTWAHSTTIEVVVWGIPVIIIGILAWLTWVGSHKYDPYRPIESEQAPLNVQVIAEQFKWVFIYPEQNIATVNELRFPVDTPVSFRLTSNFTMNSFFIPQLAGQIYAMAGMQTHLNVLAEETGVYRGFSANYSGYGFSQMRFLAYSVTRPEFDQWVAAVKAGNGTSVNPEAIQKGILDQAEFATLRDGNRAKHQIESIVARAVTPEEKAEAAKLEAEGTYPTKPHPVTYYSSVEPKLFESVINKYMSNYHGADHSAQAGAEHTGASHANVEHATASVEE
ncbi:MULTISPECIES: ubiquinol oxidase subunit II [Acinetobacter]|jgi:cytochrome o ubiquinol oxidase subunit 2|uniref:Ubiquinol oxidase subunit 2 n=1 Tax=Acinetobacter radioresistens TaxID=40216 RepID=A0A2T1IZY0_ACIRA|nr:MULTISPECIES: ubiquinol oxidase subunit II [Acinetobacter]EJO37307.1 ubiquinol oxidase, subunit II [Acinetobacter radioresistens WC-A-157]ENV88768.1 ubiquinol oxidase, subunit II [Acinetobacter radioresistens DSM 6976 = NBRC 102413 = CIP 103788]EXB35239.1 ubiquinol oxidase, subunit II [Acinetobacter sp. 1461402]EXB74073.1 ubiquinol oxidase, subunit II [Acinetobacter sp. 230853]EXC29740.1 ubiquinol oxidase, subunit II [Acinetobacter sp. 869535]